jgi:hypothetical protein
MYKVKLSPEEALETIKLRMKYDSSKTLTENVGIVKEQKSDEEFNEDVIGSYERKELNKIAQDNVNRGVKWYDVLEKWVKDKSATKKFKSRDDQFWYYAKDGIIWNFKKDGKFIYSDPDSDPLKGTWVVNGTDIKISTDDGDEYDSKTDKWKGAANTSNSNNSSTGSTSTGAASTSSIPSELKDVKDFHDWLDKTHPGWHDKYNTLDQNVSKGYGKFGPRTTKAWARYKNDYLKKTPTVTPTPTGNPDLEVDDKEASLDQPF